MPIIFRVIRTVHFVVRFFLHIVIPNWKIYVKIIPILCAELKPIFRTAWFVFIYRRIKADNTILIRPTKRTRIEWEFTRDRCTSLIHESGFHLPKKFQLANVNIDGDWLRYDNVISQIAFLHNFKTFLMFDGCFFNRIIYLILSLKKKKN